VEVGLQRELYVFIEPPIGNRLAEVDPQRLRREQINILYRALPVTLVTILIHAIALAMVQFAVVPPVHVAAWTISVLFLLLLRWYWHISYARRDEHDTSRDNRWLEYNLIGVYLSGAVWGAAGILLFPSADLLHQMTLLFILAAISAGSLTTLASYPLAIHIFLLLVLAPITLRLFWEGGDSATLIAPLAMLFTLLVNISAARAYSNILLALSKSLELEQAMNYIRESNAQNQLLLESVSEGIFGTDPDGITTFVNPAAAHMLGYQLDELIGKSMHSMIHHCHPDGRAYPKEECPMELTQLDGKPCHVTDEVFWRKDGTSLPVEYRGTPVLHNGVMSGAVVTFSDISARKQAEAQLERQAFFDSLTGLPNRVLLHDRLEQAVVQTRRHEQMGALLFLDLDQFKMINDTLGHSSGDILLREMAVRLRGTIRHEDTAARMGGDEFVVLLAGLPTETDRAINIIRNIAEKIHRRLSLPVNLSGHRLQVTCSIGITMFPFNSDHADAILMQADTAMYRAKEAGRNGTQFFLPSMQVIAEERLAMQDDLREAIARKQFKLHYQPQFDCEGRIIGAEALLRWEHPKQGLIMPHSFITLAEETGLILPVGEWVLEAGCDMLRRHSDPEAFDYLPNLAINVSPYQFRQADFVAQVYNVLQQSGIDAARLELELTENILMEDSDGVAEKMHELKKQGIRFSLDDFGTGYSSLAYLRKLPLDRLKIDQSFIAHIPGEDGSIAIVDTIISMTEHLGLDVIAEGVETQAQLDALTDMRCEQFQGFYFSRPLLEQEFVHLMRTMQGKKQAISLHE
jgi:diguanylate cyclase (GGDEF)-like protein/PAS domain S-box-containing protein